MQAYIQRLYLWRNGYHQIPPGALMTYKPVTQALFIRRKFIFGLLLLFASPASAQSLCAVTEATLVSTRTKAQTLDLSGCLFVETGGYSVVMDTGGAKFYMIPSGSLLDVLGSFVDSVGNKFQIQYPASGIPAASFGVKNDWQGVDASATENTASLEAAIAFASINNTPIIDRGGTVGATVLLPKFSSMLCGNHAIVVPFGVTIRGQGRYASAVTFCDAYGVGLNF